MYHINQDFVIYKGIKYEKDTYIWHALCIDDIEIGNELIKAMDINKYKSILNEIFKKNIIDVALTWNKTEKGYNYWFEINQKIMDEKIKMNDYPFVTYSEYNDIHKKIFNLLKA